jgi:hypothetical protein
MTPDAARRIAEVAFNSEAVTAFIAKVQRENGEIPWSEGGKTDPWDHVESAMGLSTGGRFERAELAYDWLASIQLEDGSFYAAYRNGVPEDRTRDSNFTAYIAVGVFHHYLVTGDRAFIRRLWPTVEAAVDYACTLQAPTGEIYWARNGAGVVDKMALLTGSSSIFLSLKCALALAARLGIARPRWQEALRKLGRAIRNHPARFNLTKSRYSMDWYYPMLCGAMTGEQARKRLDRYWEKFVVPEWGVRCVCDRPWATMAETSELVLTLVAMGDAERAGQVFDWLRDKVYEDGSYWMGVTFPDAVVWPEERTAWTAAAVALAHDALNGLTPASRLFRHDFWQNDERHCWQIRRIRPLRRTADSWSSPPPPREG